VKILVPVKHVARLRETFAADAGEGAVGLDPNALEWGANAWDAFSLEAALALRDGAAGQGDCAGEVIVATVGDERSEETLRAGLAMGADRAIRVWDAALAALPDRADPLGVAHVLGGLAELESPQLILCGAQSADMAHAATGVALAGLLDLPHVAFVSAIERDGERLAVQRELEGGAVELLRLAMPALLTVQTGINTPRRPNLRAIKRARAAPVSVLGLDDLGLDADVVSAAAGARTVALHARPAAPGATLLDGPPAEIAARIATIVREAIAR
jgi:electron transfer flavoprotein beta subunit